MSVFTEKHDNNDVNYHYTVLLEAVEYDVDY